MNVSCSRSFCNQLSTSLLVYLLAIFLTQRIFSILVIDVHYSHVCLSKVSACNIDALLNLQRFYERDEPLGADIAPGIIFTACIKMF